MIHHLKLEHFSINADINIPNMHLQKLFMLIADGLTDRAVSVVDSSIAGYPDHEISGVIQGMLCPIQIFFRFLFIGNITPYCTSKFFISKFKEQSRAGCAFIGRQNRFDNIVLIDPPEIWLMDVNSGEKMQLIINGVSPQWIP